MTGSPRAAPRAWRRVAGELPWPLLLAAACILMVDFGLAYGIVVAFPAVQVSLGMPAWHLTALFSISGATFLFLGVVSGPFADRHGARGIVIAGQCVLLGGLTMAAVADTELMFAIGYVAAIGGGIGLAYVPTITAVQRRAGGHAALAVGMTEMGIGLGAILGTAAAAFLIDRFGWRDGLVLAASAAGVVALAAQMLAGARDGVGRNALHMDAAPLRPVARMTAARLYVGYMLVAMVSFVPFSGLIALGDGFGWPPHTAVVMIGLVGAGSTCGRFVFAGVAERIGACRTTGVCGLVMGLAIALMAVTSLPYAFAAQALVFGAGFGGMSALTGPTVAEFFGNANLGRSVGRMVTARALGVLTGPWMVGLATERLGEHRTAWLVCGAISVVSGWMFFSARGAVRVSPPLRVGTAMPLRAGPGRRAVLVPVMAEVAAPTREDRR